MKRNWKYEIDRDGRPVVREGTIDDADPVEALNIAARFAADPNDEEEQEYVVRIRVAPPRTGANGIAGDIAAITQDVTAAYAELERIAAAIDDIDTERPDDLDAIADDLRTVRDDLTAAADQVSETRANWFPA